MVAATDQLNALFSNRNPLLRPIRMAGLRLVQKITPARQFFMKQAMGLSPLAKR
jgi:2-polyprenyl-6-methoxyphenol hydroxylase-like FAD-dependent oxidoreductase